jgi:hypothetical protein
MRGSDAPAPTGVGGEGFASLPPKADSGQPVGASAPPGALLVRAVLGREASASEAPEEALAVAEGSGIASVFTPVQARQVVDTLDRVRLDLTQAGGTDRVLIGSTVAVSTGLSVGYVVWLVRGGVLLSSVLSALPAWQTLDPLPVLARTGPREKGEGTGGDESLESIVEQGARRPPGAGDDRCPLDHGPAERVGPGTATPDGRGSQDSPAEPLNSAAGPRESPVTA